MKEQLTKKMAEHFATSLVIGMTDREAWKLATELVASFEAKGLGPALTDYLNDFEKPVLKLGVEKHEDPHRYE